jgi:hypothetical protein
LVASSDVVYGGLMALSPLDGWSGYSDDRGHSASFPSCWSTASLQASPDLVRQLPASFANALMSADAQVACNAEYREVSPWRVNRRNGYTLREWDIRAGTVDLAVPGCARAPTPGAAAGAPPLRADPDESDRDLLRPRRLSPPGGGHRAGLRVPQLSKSVTT